MNENNFEKFYFNVKFRFDKFIFLSPIIVASASSQLV